MKMFAKRVQSFGQHRHDAGQEIRGQLDGKDKHVQAQRQLQTADVFVFLHSDDFSHVLQELLLLRLT